MLKVYNRKIGQINFTYIPELNGILVEAAKINRNTGRCIWGEKVKFKIGLNDAIEIILKIKTSDYPIKLVHGNKYKTPIVLTSFIVNEGENGRGITFNISESSESSDGEKQSKKVFAFLNDQQKFLLVLLLNEFMKKELIRGSKFSEGLEAAQKKEVENGQGN